MEFEKIKREELHWILSSDQGPLPPVSSLLVSSSWNGMEALDGDPYSILNRWSFDLCSNISSVWKLITCQRRSVGQFFILSPVDICLQQPGHTSWHIHMAPHLLSGLSIPAWFRSTTWLSDPSPPRWPPWLASVVKGPDESLAVYVCPGCCAASRCDSLKLPPNNHILPPSLGNLFYHCALVTLRMLYRWNSTLCKSLRLAFSTLRNAHRYLLLTCTHDPKSS